MGVASLNVAVVAAPAPVFVTTCVYVMLLPAATGFGDATFVTVSSPFAVTPTTVFTVAVLLGMFGSLAEELTVAVCVITVPLAVPGFTFITSVNVPAVEPAMFELVHTTVAGPGVPGVMQDHPAGATIDAKAVFAGTVSTSVALSAALGPLLVTTCV